MPRWPTSTRTPTSTKSPQASAWPVRARVPDDGPLGIAGAALQIWSRSDLGTPSPALWRDQSGNGRDFAAAGGQQPTFNPSDSSLGGRPTFTGNGTTNVFVSTYIVPLPGTTPTYYWAIIKQVSNAASAAVLGCTNHGIYTGALASPGMQQVAGVLGPANNGAAIGSWVCMEAQFNNATTDFLRLGATEVTGAAAGTNGGAVLCLFALNGGANFGNYAIAEIFAMNAAPTAAQRAAFRAYGRSLYPTVAF